MSKKILVADDDPAILDVIQLMLEDEGYEVETSVDGETIYTMEREYPDLLLLDIWMSGVDGRDICKYVKKNKHLKDIPILMFSANKDGAKIAHEAGAEGFIAKPFEMDDLLSKIKTMVYNEAR